ncbi:MAG: Hpt domain-containing protein, partial [Actinomycetia bacterium]|nr:Hpt domain-containing protein [Actinomycetes bacterium]
MDEDLLQEFIAETSEGLDALDDDLVKLETNPNDQGVIDRIFRVIHTIKGTCGFLSLKRLEKISHSTENLLGKFRSHELEITSDLITLVLSCVDRIRFITDHVGRHTNEPDGSDEELIALLDHALLGNTKIEKNEQAQAKPPVEAAAPKPFAAPPPPPIQAAPKVADNSPPSESDIEDAMIAAEMA